MEVNDARRLRLLDELAESGKFRAQKRGDESEPICVFREALGEDEVGPCRCDEADKISVRGDRGARAFDLRRERESCLISEAASHENVIRSPAEAPGLDRNLVNS
jgi:hypothetical protein